MPTDLQAVYTQIIDNLRFDHGPSSHAKSGQAALRKQCTNGTLNDKTLADAYLTWLGVYERLKSTALTGDIGKAMEPVELKRLLAWSDPEDRNGCQLVTNYVARQFLGDFHKAYAIPLQTIICECALQEVTKKFTGFWAKHVDTLMEITTSKVNSAQYGSYAPSINTLNALSYDADFASKLKLNKVKGDTFNADPDKLAGLAVNAADPLKGFSFKLGDLYNIAQSSNHYAYETSLYNAYIDFNASVSPAWNEYKTAVAKLAALKERSHANDARGRKYI